MCKIKTFFGTHARWLIPLAAVLLVVTVCLCMDSGRVTFFRDPNEYDASTTQLTSTGDRQAVYELTDVDPVLRNGWPDSNRGGSGIIAVVRATDQHENVLGMSDPDGGYRILEAHKTYPEIQSPSYQFMDYRSAVRTKVEILEILYQSDEYDYQVGEQVQLREPYFIADQSVPGLLENTEKTHRYELDGWNPMQNDQIYIVFAQPFTYNWKNAAAETVLVPYPGGAFCLSDTSIPAGCAQNAAARAENLTYLWNNYPEIMEKYADK